MIVSILPKSTTTKDPFTLYCFSFHSSLCALQTSKFSYDPITCSDSSVTAAMDYAPCPFEKEMDYAEKEMDYAPC